VRINRVLIIPSAGHTDDNGKFSRGHTVDTTSEYDVVNQYLRPLEEILEEYSIRHRTLPVREHPGIRFADRIKSVFPNDLVICLGVGWFTTRREKNCSAVYFGGQDGFCLSDLLCDTMSEWGHCSNYGHRSGLPKKVEDPILTVSETIGIRIEPLALNGPNYIDYLYRLHDLGRDLGHCLVDYLARRGEAQNRPQKAGGAVNLQPYR